MTLAEITNAHDSMIRVVRADLHELSQPLTVLLCTLEFGVELTSVSEMRLVLASAVLECERMKRIVSALREKLPLEAGCMSSLIPLIED